MLTLLTRCWVLQMERGNRELELVVKHPDLPKHLPRRIQNTNQSLVLKPPLSRLHSSRQPKLCTYSSQVSNRHEWEAWLSVLLSVISSAIIGLFISFINNFPFSPSSPNNHQVQNTLFWSQFSWLPLSIIHPIGMPEYCRSQLIFYWSKHWPKKTWLCLWPAPNIIDEHSLHGNPNPHELFWNITIPSHSITMLWAFALHTFPIQPICERL